MQISEKNKLVEEVKEKSAELKVIDPIVEEI